MLWGYLCTLIDTHVNGDLYGGWCVSAIIAPDGDTGNATAPAYGHMIVRNWTTGGAMVCLYGGHLSQRYFDIFL